MSKTVLLDTNFLIHFVKSDSALHRNATEYAQYFIDNEILMKVSIISIAEFNVYSDFSVFASQSMCIPVGYDIHDANRSSDFARVLYDQRKKGLLDVATRVIIPNDTKLFATADSKNIDYYLTSDQDNSKMYDILNQHFQLKFKFIDLHIPCAEYFKKLF